jgi:hypothetical protein
MSEVDKDAAAILDLHDGWNKGNLTLVVEELVPFFAEGDNLLQFNLNGLTYHGIDDLARLWRNLPAAGIRVVRLEETNPPTVQIFGDVALLTSEAEVDVVVPTPSGTLETTGTTRFRNTEFYRRDDGSGRPEWRIWHMHVSAAAPEGTQRYVTE